jgi:uncharacterized protein (TIGR03067 family)
MSVESGRTHDVFLSYSSHDKTWADAACAVLERQGVRCWIAPRDITHGEEWGAAIIKGINESRIMVLIFSGHANASGQVRRELERAISRGIAVLPIRIEDVRPEGAMEYALGNRHWLDAFAPPVEKQLELLARSVKTLLGNDAAAIPGAPTSMPTAGGSREPFAPAPRPAPRPWYLSRLTVGLAVMLTVMIVAGSFVMFRDRTVLTVPTVQPIAAPSPRSDQERIQGRWKLVDPPKAPTTKKKGIAAGEVWEFSGTNLTVYRSVDQDVRDYLIRGSFSLSTGVERKLFDVSTPRPDGRPMEILGIYELEGEFLKVCFGIRLDNDPDFKRPDSFVPAGGTLRMYRKFKRLEG